MPVGNGSLVACLIPQCFRRQKSPPPSSKSTGNVFEERMRQRLKKKTKQNRRSTRTQLRSAYEEFATFDLLAARDRSVAAKNANRVRKQQWPHVLSWDSAADTYVSPPSSVGAEAGGVMGTTHTNTPPDYDPETSSRFSALLTRQEIPKKLPSAYSNSPNWTCATRRHRSCTKCRVNVPGNGVRLPRMEAKNDGDTL